MAISHGHLSTPALAPPMQSLEGKVAVPSPTSCVLGSLLGGRDPASLMPGADV